MFAPHYRLTASGDFGGGATPVVEHFSFGVCLTKGSAEGGLITGDTLDLDNDQKHDLVTDTTAFFSRATSHIAPQCHLTQVKIASIGADGKYTADPYIETMNVVGGAVSGSVHPPQVAVAVSLVTERRGPSGKGRFYVPGFMGNVDLDTWEIETPLRLDLQNSAAQWLTAIGDEPGIDVLGLRACVASSKGYNTSVSGVRVGKAFDTIRTRRRSLKETYLSPATVTWL